MQFTKTALLAILASLACLATAAPVVPGRNSTSIPMDASQDPSNANNATLLAALQLAPSAVDRINMLNGGSDWVFDFLNPDGNATSVASGNGGHTVRTSRSVWPALTGTGVSMTVGFLGPCGFNTPHIHPRSSEINFVAEGSLLTEFIGENEANIVRARVDQYQVTVFPKGSVHTEFNPTCGQAIFVSGFSDEDPGTLQVAQTFFGLDDDLIQATLQQGGSFAGEDIDVMRSLIPKNVALGVESCLATCGLTKRSVPAKA